MSTLADLLAQRAAIEQKIAALQGEARAEAISKVRALMVEYDLSVTDIAGKATRTISTSAKKGVVAVKYRDNLGNSWTGRGLKPKWLNAAIASGKKIEDFAV